MTSLNTAPVGEPLEIKWITGSRDLLKRIQELGKAGEKAAMLTIADKRRRLLEIVNNPDEKTDNILKAIDLDNKMEGVYTNKTELSGGIEYVLNWGDGPNGE